MHSLLCISTFLLLATSIADAVWQQGYQQQAQQVQQAQQIAFGPPHGLISLLCGFPEVQVTGAEGCGISEKDYDLAGLAIVFRHGERSPAGVLLSEYLSEQIRNQTLAELVVDADVDAAAAQPSWRPTCSPFRHEDARSFADLSSTIDSEDFSAFVEVDANYADRRKYPEIRQCAEEEMTAGGALQLYHLGSFLKQRYATSRLFDGEAGAPLTASVVASNYTRTFQSAIAFTAGFLFPLRDVISKLPITWSADYFLCTRPECVCPKAEDFRRKYALDSYFFWLNESPRPIFARAERIFKNISATAARHDPFEYMDIMLGRYACRHRPLPCTFYGECVSEQLMSELTAEMSRRGQQMFYDGRGRRVMAAEAQAILGELADQIEQLAKNASERSIKVFSGHDITVAPILRVLGLAFLDTPPYASRIVVEIYRPNKRYASRDLFFRLLYNGVDRTAQLPFCRGSRLCSATSLQLFARQQLFLNAGFRNVDDLCERTQEK